MLTMFSGNAKLEGMVTQLDLTGNRYNAVLVMMDFYSCSSLNANSPHCRRHFS